MALVLWISLVFVQATLGLAKDYLPCYSNITECSVSLKALLVDESVFWFGKDFAKTCPSYLAQTPRCSNPDRERYSIISRLFNLTKDQDAKTYVPENLQVAQITFNVPEASYFACGHEFQSPAVKYYDVDPTRVMPMSLYAMDHEPYFRWVPYGTYTVIVLDVGYYFVHAVYVNVIGSDVSTGTAIKPFRGPKNSQLRPNIYVIAVFYQPGNIDVTQAAQAFNNVLYSNGGTLPLHAFIKQLPIEQDLYAANIMITKGDAYGMQFQKERYITNNCPILVSQQPALKAIMDGAGVDLDWTLVDSTFVKNPKPYLDSLSVDISMVYELPEDVTVESCCSQQTFTLSMFMPDPFSSRSVRAIRVSHKPRVNLSPMSIIGDVYNSFRTKPYTLMMVDIMNQDNGEHMFFVHWMVNNIKDGKVEKGDEILTYFPPTPFERANPHAYIFLLFEQNTPQLDVSNWSMYVEDCPNSFGPRCGRDIGGLLKAFNFDKLRGVTWFLAEQDAFVRKNLYTKYNAMLEEEVCQGVPGYEYPCPEDNYPNSGHVHIYGVTVLLVTTVTSIFSWF